MCSLPRIAVSATRLRAASPHARLAAGLVVAGNTGRLSAAVVAATEPGSLVPIEVLTYATTVAPDDVCRLLAHLVNDAEPALPAKLVAALAQRLAEIEAELLLDLLSVAEVRPERLLVATVHDPGVWNLSEDRLSGYAGLCDAATLAQRSGCNVLDALPARDLAAGGAGGPVTALAEARMLRSRQRHSLLVDFGRTVRATYVPAAGITRARGEASPAVLSFHVGPGLWLLDALSHKLTGGRQAIDLGGRLAVQGQQIPELLAHWMKDHYFERPLPRWQPAGVRPERFLMDSYQLAVKSGWSVRDLLCTATHFVAQTVADAIHRQLLPGRPVDELIVCGGGIHNGLLMRQLAARVEGIPIVRIADRCCPVEAFEAATVATVGLLTVDHMPATTPEITGACQPCVAGRLTPANPPAWRRLVAEMGQSTSGSAWRQAS